MNPPAVPKTPSVEMPSTTPLQSATTTTLPESGAPQQNKKILFSIIGVIILTVTTVSGFFLIARPILYNSNAWSCGEYTFSLSSTGVVSVKNGSVNSEPVQRADVYINSQLKKTFDVPALNAGASTTIGSVTIPTTNFSWQIKGTSDCTNSGNIELNQTSYQCQNITAYSEDGTKQLTSSDLMTLKEGDTILLVAKGSSLSSNYNAAKFTINGVEQNETILKMISGDYYMRYTIPTGVSSFKFKAQLKALDGNWY